MWHYDAMASRRVEPGTTTIGFVGLGNMGRPMAGHLVAAGYEVRVHDLAPGPVADLASQGATAVADVLITMLPGPTQIAQVMSELLGLVDQVFQRARRHYGDAAGEMRPFQLYEDLVGRPLRYAATSAPAAGQRIVV